MNKTFTLVALVLLLGGVSAIDWNSSVSWNSKPQIIVNGKDDTNLTNKTLSLFYGTNVIVVLGDNGNGTSTERNVSVKDLSFTKNSEFTIITNDTGNDGVTPANNVRLYAKIDQTNGADQVTLYKGQFIAGAQNVPLTKNDNKTLKFSVYQVFAHRTKYFVVYKIDNGTINVASVGVNDANVQTFPLTNNGSTFANCAGLSGKDEGLYCLFQNNIKDPRNASLWTTILAETVITSLATTNNTPVSYDYNQGNNYNMTSIDYFFAYNAGKQWGGVISVNKVLSTKNGNTNKTVVLALPPTPAGYQAPEFAGYAPYKDQLAILYTYRVNAVANLPAAENYTSAVQYVGKDGSVDSWNYVFGNATNLEAVQYSDGSLYIVAQNSTHAYLGGLWGSTGLSATIVQTAFAAVCAFAAAIFLL